MARFEITERHSALGLGATVRAAAISQAELADAVAAAREHGHTWTQFATMLGTSRQAAQERYGEPAKRP